MPSASRPGRFVTWEHGGESGSTHFTFYKYDEPFEDGTIICLSVARPRDDNSEDWTTDYHYFNEHDKEQLLRLLI